MAFAPRVYTVPALVNTDNTPVTGRDRKLCPVRALLCYRKRIIAMNLVGADQRLFRGFVGRLKGVAMKAHSISYYLRQTVKLSYDLLEDATVSSVIKMKPHEIRAVSVSLASLKHVPVKEILAKAESTFASFYLKDLSKFCRKVRGGGKAVVLAHSIAY